MQLQDQGGTRVYEQGQPVVQPQSVTGSNLEFLKEGPVVSGRLQSIFCKVPGNIIRCNSELGHTVAPTAQLIRGQKTKMFEVVPTV